MGCQSRNKSVAIDSHTQNKTQAVIVTDMLLLFLKFYFDTRLWCFDASFERLRDTGKRTIHISGEAADRGDYHNNKAKFQRSFAFLRCKGKVF